MPKTIQTWTWEEVFDRYGFDDGNGWNGTNIVAEDLKEVEYECECTSGSHNYYICSLKRGSQIIEGDDPREFLPREVVRFLDQRFPDDFTVELP